MAGDERVDLRLAEVYAHSDASEPPQRLKGVWIASTLPAFH